MYGIFLGRSFSAMRYMVPGAPPAAHYIHDYRKIGPAYGLEELEPQRSTVVEFHVFRKGVFFFEFLDYANPGPLVAQQNVSNPKHQYVFIRHIAST